MAMGRRISILAVSDYSVDLSLIAIYRVTETLLSVSGES